MKLMQLRYFQTICKYNNITRAANELHVSQPSLSSVVHELEAEFGLTLFVRTGRGMILTPDGEQFLQEASALLRNADEFSSHMHALGDAGQPVIFGVPPMLGTLIFPEFLELIQKELPSLSIHIRECGSLSCKSMVQDGTLDMAIISSFSPPTPLASFRLGSTAICLYVNRRHPLASCGEIRPDLLSATPLAILGDDTFMTAFVRQYLKQNALTNCQFIQTNQISTIRRLLENGTAAAFLFDGILELENDLIKLPLSVSPTADVYLIWKKTRAASGGVRKISRLIKHCGLPSNASSIS